MKIKNYIALRNSTRYFIIFTLFLGAIIRLLFTIRYTTFAYIDQARDTDIYQSMWQGVLPVLGPEALRTANQPVPYHLPPLYYYLSFPFTIFGKDPLFSVVFNALISFLTILLLAYFIYKLLENIENDKRLFLSVLAGFWYSLLFAEIFINTYSWNPSSIPFFVLAFILLLNYQLTVANQSFKFQLLSWAIYGVVLAILTSLHSTTLFVMPVIALISVIHFVVLRKDLPQIKKLILILVSLVCFAIALLPYWRGELNSGFRNTKDIILAVIDFSGKGSSLGEKLNRIFQAYFELGSQVYFVGDSKALTVFAVLFMALTLGVGLIKFRGKKLLLIYWLLTNLLYLFAASNYTGNFYVHYKLIILMTPLVLTILSLAYLKLSNHLEKIIFIVCGISLLLSIAFNLQLDYKYLVSKYGTQRLMSSSDMAQILQQIPKNSTICTYDPRPGWVAYEHPYRYIDKYITKRNLKILAEREFCQAGNYYISPNYFMLQRNDYLFPDFTIVENHPLFYQNSSFVWENSAAKLYQVN